MDITSQRVASSEPVLACHACPVRGESLCSTVDEAAFASLAAVGQVLSYPPRATLFMEGDPVSSVYNVTRGVVRAYRLLRDGRRQLVGFALPGELVGAVVGASQPFSADALGAVVACRFPRTAFWDALCRGPLSIRGIYDAAVQRLNSAYDQMLLLGCRSAEQKVAAFILGFRDRWHRGAAGSLVPLPMSRQDIGDYLGLGISTVSRTLTTLARKRLIVIVRGGVRILDFEGLTGLTR